MIIARSSTYPFSVSMRSMRGFLGAAVGCFAAEGPGWWWSVPPVLAGEAGDMGDCRPFSEGALALDAGDRGEDFERGEGFLGLAVDGGRSPMASVRDWLSPLSWKEGEVGEGEDAVCRKAVAVVAVDDDDGEEGDALDGDEARLRWSGLSPGGGGPR